MACAGMHGGIFMSENNLNEKMKRKPWPMDCVWPEPLQNGAGMAWEADFVPDALDETARDLMEIKGKRLIRYCL